MVQTVPINYNNIYILLFLLYFLINAALMSIRDIFQKHLIIFIIQKCFLVVYLYISYLNILFNIFTYFNNVYMWFF